MVDAALYLHSSARENVIEHLFIGELLRTLWCQGVYEVEVLRSEVDDCGYDLVVECRGVLRHIQLKSSHHLGHASRQTINAKIEKKIGGCVVWIMFDAKTLSLGPFRWLGSNPGGSSLSLGSKLGKHTKANSLGVKTERPNMRIVSKSGFAQLNSMDDLVEKLFGNGAAA
jgi:hypothetical protein